MKINRKKSNEDKQEKMGAMKEKVWSNEDKQEKVWEQ